MSGITWLPKNDNEINKFCKIFNDGDYTYYVILVKPFPIIRSLKSSKFNQENFAYTSDGYVKLEKNNNQLIKIYTPYIALAKPLAEAFLKLKIQGANIIIDAPNDFEFNEVFLLLSKLSFYNNALHNISIPLYQPQRAFWRAYIISNRSIVWITDLHKQSN